MITMRHRHLNNILTVFIVVFALYIIVTPYIPEILWRLRPRTSAPYAGALAESTGDTSKATAQKPPENRIVLPSAGINLPIVEGNGIWVIDSGGSWRKNLWVNSPKEAGNTVVVAHRFSYRNPDGGFYHLDKVRVGDKLAVYWQGEELLYEVREVKTVEPTAVEVEANTSGRTLTLYTCTPVITAEHRLVVIAVPVEVGRE